TSDPQTREPCCRRHHANDQKPCARRPVHRTGTSRLILDVRRRKKTHTESATTAGHPTQRHTLAGLQIDAALRQRGLVWAFHRLPHERRVRVRPRGGGQHDPPGFFGQWRHIRLAQCDRLAHEHCCSGFVDFVDTEIGLEVCRVRCYSHDKPPL